MKIIHTSDIHLDSPLTARLKDEKKRRRARELVGTFRRICEEAVKTGAEAVLISGDLFDGERAKNATLRAVLSAIENAPNVTFFYINGNHERDMLRGCSERLPENLKIFGDGMTYFELSGVVFCGAGRLSSDMLSTARLDADKRNILLFHGELSDKTAAPEKIGRSELAALPIDYVALGHYHSYSKERISSRCTAVYSGTPEGRGFDECGECGYVLINVTRDGVSHRFCRFAERLLHTVDVDISDIDSDYLLEKKIRESIARIPECDFVRVVLRGTHGADFIRDTVGLSDRIGTPYFFFEIKDESRLKISPEDYKNDISLKGEFIRLVLSDGTLSEKEKSRMIECGIRALSGEEVI